MVCVDTNNSGILLPPEKVMIGFLTRSVIAKQDLLPREQKTIAKNCQYFMIEAYNYATSRLPVSDPVLQHAQVL